MKPGIVTGAAIAAAALGLASPAHAAICGAEAAIRADPRWRYSDCDMCMLNRVYVGPGRGLHWNGASVTLATLRRYLDIVRQMNPVPFTLLFIRPGADCGLLAGVRATIEQALPCERPHCSFARVDNPPPPSSRRRNRH